MLSIRANAFLATLERHSRIPTKDVESIIRDQGLPCFAVWLDFHDRFSGYLERFGRDWAIWGLVHQNPQWLLPRKADADREPNEELWYITCADAHPSYSYRIDSKGEFLSAPAISFDVHIERIALGRDFQEKTKCRALSKVELSALDEKEVIAKQLKPFQIAEASDCFSKYYMNDSYFLVEDASSGKLRKGQVKV